MNSQARPTKSYKDYLNLFEDRMASLGHRDLLVFPDRAIGPSAEQALMDARSNPRTSAHPWPSPGIYTSLRFAKSFAKALCVPPEMSKTELISRWLTLWPDRSLSSLVEIWPRVDTLLAHSTSSAFWFQVCTDATKSDDPELSDWMQALLLTMTWCLCCEEENLVGSRWHFLENVIRALPSLTQQDWIIATERNPWLMENQSLVLHVPLLKAPFPIENRFFETMRSLDFVDLIFYKETRPADSIRDLSALPWHEPSQRPDVFVVTGKMRSLTYTLLESDLAKWKLDLPSISESPLKYDIHHLTFLKDRDLDSIEDLQLQNQLRDLYQLLAAHRTHVASADLLASAEFSGLLTLNIAKEGVHPCWSARGVSCISIDDAWALPRQKICLVSSLEDYRELWDPLSQTQRAKAPIPHALTHLITSNHVAVSSSTEEAIWAQAFFEERASDFSRWNSPPESSPNLVPPPTPTVSDLSARTLSPSGIEALLRCPFQFYDQRILRNQENAELNSLNINALKRGEWLHKALEDFFAKPDFSANATAIICRSLETHLETYFFDICSADYLIALRKRIPKFGEDLAKYLLSIEAPLQNLWPQRQHQQEISLSTHHMGISLRGKVDRLDLIGNNRALLWDYKSGGSYQYHLKTLLGPNHRKIQWFLYTKMVAAHSNLDIVGGGYLQLLNAENSGIYFFADKLAAVETQSLKTIFEQSDYSPKWINSSDLHVADEELHFAMEHTKSVMKNGIFERRPLKDALCDSCSSKVACGRPYFASSEASPS